MLSTPFLYFVILHGASAMKDLRVTPCVRAPKSRPYEQYCPKYCRKIVASDCLNAIPRRLSGRP